MKVRDVIKLVEKDGWFVVRTKGSHRQYKQDTSPCAGSRVYRWSGPDTGARDKAGEGGS
jgi:hypothetical protein